MAQTILEIRGTFIGREDTCAYYIQGAHDLAAERAAWAGPEEITATTRADWPEDTTAGYDTHEGHLDLEDARRLLRGELDPWTLEDRTAA